MRGLGCFQAGGWILASLLPLLLVSGPAFAGRIPISAELGPAVTELALSHSSVTLLVGESVQLQATATFEDGSRLDVTADPATYYVPAAVPGVDTGVVAVEAAGRIRAVGPGRLLLTVGHNSGLDTFAYARVWIAIHSAGDLDGDGLSNDYELANGLDPNFSADADADPDGDGLTNLEEASYGTLPLSADSDGDGVEDLIEIIEGTSPTSPDHVGIEVDGLDEHCFVSVLNRTARADADGIWVLPNVPANIGRVRIRATCIEDGVTRSGQSDFVSVPPDGVVRIPEISFESPVPVPASLRLDSSLSVLDTVGQTARLTATAILPDGSEIDVSDALSGTEYSSTNDSVVSVDGDGLLTAHGSGSALLSAVHEGSLALVRVRVAMGGDSDLDGLPDDYEAAYGLDPQDPTDALSDRDGDGLSALREFQLGLDPGDVDSDDDRLGDGEEVDVLATDPLRFDSDGDQVSDGLEVQVGSDPLSATSVDLTGLVTGLDVTPTDLAMVFNTVIGEVSRRLAVRATLVDGTVIDATDALYGTVYSSSNLAVAGFGLEPGRVFGGQDGDATITVDLDLHSVEVAVAVTSFAPQALSVLPLRGYLNAIEVREDTAYIAAGGAGLHIVDITDPAAPSLVSTTFESTFVNQNANGLDVVGSIVYLAAGDRLLIIDAADPTTPLQIGSVGLGHGADVVVENDTAYVVGANGLRVYDVSDPASPSLIGFLGTPGYSRGIAMTDAPGTMPGTRPLALIADTSGGLRVVDVSDPGSPIEIGFSPTRFGGASNASGVVVRGSRAFVADGADGRLGGLRVVDFSVPEAPFPAATTGNAFGLTSVVLDGPFALTSDIFFVNAVPIFQIEDPSPIFQATVPFQGAPGFREDNGQDLVARDGLVYMVGNQSSFADNGRWGNGALHIGRYLELQDQAGIPPTAVIEFPADGAELLERRAVDVEISAADDLRVERVELWLDAALMAVDRWPPYVVSIDLPGDRATVELVAKAFDQAGSEGVSEPVTLGILADDEPTVRLLSPTGSAVLYEGDTVTLTAVAADDVAVTQVDLKVDGVSRAVLTEPPYTTEVPIPLGAVGLELSAEAVDGLGQRAVDGRTVAVQADPPPEISILEPAEGTALTASSTLRIQVGAGDNLPLARVELVVDGVAQPALTEAPFEWAATAPASGNLSVQATAEDSLGQRTSSSRLFATQADPLTTVRGTVLDGSGAGIAAAVTCAGVSGTSMADGSFEVGGVPTLDPLVTCQASAAGRSGLSAGVPPEPAGLVDVGPIRLSGSMLWIGGGGNNGAGADRLYLHDEETAGLVGWSEIFSPNLVGLVLDDQARLWAADITPPPAVGEAPRSEWRRLDSETGAVLQSVGFLREAGTGGGGGGGGGGEIGRAKAPGDLVGVADLTWDPIRQRILMLETNVIQGGNRIMIVDPETAEVDLLVSTTSYLSGGLTIGGDGRLYVVRRSVGSLILEIRDPSDGFLLESHSLGSATSGVGSLTVGADGELLLLYRNLFHRITPDPWTLTQITTPSPVGGEGSFSIVESWVPGFVPVTATITGHVTDAFGSPLQGATVRYVGASTTTDAAGAFSLEDVGIRTSRFRVFVEFGSQNGVSDPLDAVAGPIAAGTVVVDGFGGGGGG